MTQETPTTAKERARKALVNFSNTDKFSELELIESVTQAITEAEEAASDIAYDKGYNLGQRTEREACAKVAKKEVTGAHYRQDLVATRIATAIQARGES